MKINKIKNNNLIKIIYLFIICKLHQKNLSTFIERFFFLSLPRGSLKREPLALPLGPKPRAQLGSLPRWA